VAEVPGGGTVKEYGRGLGRATRWGWDIVTCRSPRCYLLLRATFRKTERGIWGDAEFAPDAPFRFAEWRLQVPSRWLYHPVPAAAGIRFGVTIGAVTSYWKQRPAEPTLPPAQANAILEGITVRGARPSCGRCSIRPGFAGSGSRPGRRCGWGGRRWTCSASSGRSPARCRPSPAGPAPSP